MNNIPCARCEYDPTLTVTRAIVITVNMPAVSGNSLRKNDRGWGGRQYRALRNRYLEAIRRQTLLEYRAQHKRRVFFAREYTGRSRAFDTDNLAAGMKPLRDCLTELGLLVDDSPRWVQAYYSQAKTDANRIVILLEDIDGWQTETKED